MKKIFILLLIGMILIGGSVYANEKILTWEEVGDNYFITCKLGKLNAEVSGLRAIAAYQKAILEEEKKQTELLQLIYYKDQK